MSQDVLDDGSKGKMVLVLGRQLLGTPQDIPPIRGKMINCADIIVTAPQARFILPLLTEVWLRKRLERSAHPNVRIQPLELPPSSWTVC